VLPNGLQDVKWSSQAGPSVPSDMRQRVNTLLNPCHCKSLWKCECRPRTSSGRALASPKVSNGLASLALAAAMRCDEETVPSRIPLSVPSTSSNAFEQPKHRITPPRSDYKYNMHPPHPVQSQEDLSLPPIHPISSISASSRVNYIPTIPPMSTMSMIAGSGCTCGFQCACPGCVEHRGPEHVSHDPNDLANGRCTSCVDHSLAIELPPSATASTSSAINSRSSSIMDRFLARAAALPLPPVNRQMGAQIDPMNVMAYPAAARVTGERGVAFGLVNLPKLECCGGLCSCPEGECSCRKCCNGDCAEHATTPTAVSAIGGVTNVQPVKSCCAGKRTMPS